MASTLEILSRLTSTKVEFVLVGGMASAAYGCSLVTDDVDVCVRFDLATLTGITQALSGLEPRMRMSPQRPPLPVDATALVGFKNLYVVTTRGQVDFLGQITGVGGFAELRPNSEEIDLGDFKCQVMGIEDLIKSKRAMGRPKDLRAVVELEAIRANRPAK
jgi:predicted nucleotidyltransferase